MRTRLAARALLLATLSSSSFAPAARASNPLDFASELITPAGWEVQVRTQRCAHADEVGSSVELVTPREWTKDGRGGEPSWGGCMYSELVVPREWARVRKQAHGADWP